MPLTTVVAGHGRHRSGAVRSGHVRVAVDAADGTGAGAGRGAAREMLIDRAAALWSVDRATLTCKDGRITGGGKSVRLRRSRQGPEARRHRSRRRAGLAGRRVDGPRHGRAARSTAAASSPAEHRYTPDITRPGMMYGRVIRSDGYTGTLVSLDDAAARALRAWSWFATATSPASSRRPNGSRAAPRPPSAPSGACRPVRRRLRPIYEHLKKTGTPAADAAARRSGRRRRGRARRGAPGRSTPATASPTSRTCRSSRAAAVAEWTDGKLTVWTGTQRPFGVRSELAEAFRVPEERVRVIVPDTGSAYGGKHTGEHAVEAARLAKAAGKPVKLVWTRKEEFSYGYFRPAGVIDVKAGVDADGPADVVGVRQLELRRLGDPDALRDRRASASSSIRRTRRCARARTAGWPRRRTTTRARCTWTPSRARSASMPSSSGCGI